MKTAKEWAEEFWRGFGEDMPSEYVEVLFRKAQLDAYKAGMTEAAAVCFAQYELNASSHFNWGIHACEAAIEAARDAKTP